MRKSGQERLASREAEDALGRRSLELQQATQGLREALVRFEAEQPGDLQAENARLREELATCKQAAERLGTGIEASEDAPEEQAWQTLPGSLWEPIRALLDRLEGLPEGGSGPGSDLRDLGKEASLLLGLIEDLVAGDPELL